MQFSLIIVQVNVVSLLVFIGFGSVTNLLIDPIQLLLQILSLVLVSYYLLILALFTALTLVLSPLHSLAQTVNLMFE